MNITRLHHALCYALLLLWGACSEEKVTDIIQPSQWRVDMECRGGKSQITFVSGYWDIVGVIDPSAGGAELYGEIDTNNGSYVVNEKLQLIGTGTIRYQANGRGFCVVREETDLLSIELYENKKEADFNFILVLQSNKERKEILVSQKGNLGYSFEKIEYFLQENEGMASRTERGMTFNVPTNWNPFRTWPLYNSPMTYGFGSKDQNAFYWTESDSISVPIPVGVEGGKLIFDNTQGIYMSSMGTIRSSIQELWVDVPISEEKHRFHSVFDIMTLRASYVLTLKSRRDQHLRTVEGKFVCTFPTGWYLIVWD